ncbi:hypothetical protein EDM59_22795 [Brevibacillus nitrificans]|uniref:LysM domain-containing protein n=1 Tax=Brevibacillus nitrificans TaxID=651560 RepID=A0A3M8D1L6_9BACL|nr:hypothetical protein [Brevibacillus nitrificans]RNB81461.1 hypothetical protein EDM59_22795 [Brevibacillus nitrificans]
MFSKAKMGMLLGAMAAVLSIGSLGSAMAADTTQTQAQTQKQIKDLNKPADVKFGGNMGHRGGFGFGGGFGYEKNEELLTLLNLDAAKLSEELKAGKTLAQVVEAQGVDEDDVIALLVKQQEDKLAEAVKAGKLTQEQADKMNENAADRVKEQLENTHQGKGPGGFGFGGGFGYEKNEELLTLLNLDAAKLSEELKAGKTLAQVAEAQGVDEDDVIALLVKQQEDKLAEAVKAGKLTQEQADKMNENAADRVKEQLENTHQGKGPGGFGFGGGFGYEKNEELLTLLNLDAAKLSEELKAGKTLAQVAEAQGVDEDDVIALLVKQEEAKLAEAVKAGKLTQEQADKMTENSAERVKAMVENTHQDRGHGKMMFGFGFGKNEELLTLLKLDEAKFKEELTAGKSLAAIAEAQGVEKQEVIDLLVSKQEEQLAEAVKAGKLTQEEADKRSAEFATIAEKVVDGTFEKVAFPRKEKEQDSAEKTTVTE